MGKTLAEKVWDAHIVSRARASLTCSTSTSTSSTRSPAPRRSMDCERRPRRTSARPHHGHRGPQHPTIEIDKPIADPVSRAQVERCARTAPTSGSAVLPRPRRAGIVHVVGPQLGLTQPA